MCFGEQPRGFLKVKILAVLQAKRQETIVPGLAVEVRNDLLRAPAQDRVAAQDVGSEPPRGLRTVRKDFFPHRLIDSGVLIGQQVEKGSSSALRELFR